MSAGEQTIGGEVQKDYKFAQAMLDHLLMFRDDKEAFTGLMEYIVIAKSIYNGENKSGSSLFNKIWKQIEKNVHNKTRTRGQDFDTLLEVTKTGKELETLQQLHVFLYMDEKVGRTQERESNKLLLITIALNTCVQQHQQAQNKEKINGDDKLAIEKKVIGYVSPKSFASLKTLFLLALEARIKQLKGLLEAKEKERQRLEAIKKTEVEFNSKEVEKSFEDFKLVNSSSDKDPDDSSKNLFSSYRLYHDGKWHLYWHGLDGNSIELELEEYPKVNTMLSMKTLKADFVIKPTELQQIKESLKVKGRPKLALGEQFRDVKRQLMLIHDVKPPCKWEMDAKLKIGPVTFSKRQNTLKEMFEKRAQQAESTKTDSTNDGTSSDLHDNDAESSTKPVEEKQVNSSYKSARDLLASTLTFPSQTSVKADKNKEDKVVASQQGAASVDAKPSCSRREKASYFTGASAALLTGLTFKTQAPAASNGNDSQEESSNLTAKG